MSKDSLWVLLEKAARTRPDDVYCSYGGEQVTIEALLSRANAVGDRLRKLGLRSGSRVAVMLPNSLEHVYIIFGLLRAGLVYVPINARAKGPGLEHILVQSKPDMIIAHGSVASSINAAITASGWDGIPLWLDSDAKSNGLDELLAPARDDTEIFEAELSAQPVDDVVCISYTSGTTGPPKGVQVTGHMLLGCATAVSQATDPRPGDTFLLWEPFYHVGGHQVLILGIIEPVQLAILPRFSASTFWADARSLGATHIHYLGGVLQILLRQPPSDTDREHSVRIAWGAGATEDAWNEFSDRFAVGLREVYGLTETSSINTINRTNRVGSMGTPCQGFTIEIVNDQGESVQQGATGEIRMKSADPRLLTSGYFRDPTATRQLLPGDGWLYTGDNAHTDATGFLYFDGRRSDNVRVRGENVSAWEVESVVRDHPAISDCAMVGVPSELGEQDIKLLVQVADGAEVSEQDIVDWCAERLGPHQVPRFIGWITDFPRTPSMRILKHDLSKSIAGCWDRSINSLKAEA